MATNLCFGLTLLLVPAMIGLFSLQAAYPLSHAGHTLLEALILGGISWLFVLILRLDKWLYLQNYLPQKSKHVHHQIEIQQGDHVIQYTEIDPIKQPK